MKLYVHKESSIRSIQKEFSDCYPFLKVEFYKNYSKGQPLPKALILTPSELTKNIGLLHHGLAININKSRKVFEVEKDFENLSGMSALVFRKSGNVWVETSLTDDWTLEEQNKEGEQISLHFQ